MMIIFWKIDICSIMSIVHDTRIYLSKLMKCKSLHRYRKLAVIETYSSQQLLTDVVMSNTTISLIVQDYWYIYFEIVFDFWKNHLVFFNQKIKIIIAILQSSSVREIKIYVYSAAAAASAL